MDKRQDALTPNASNKRKRSSSSKYGYFSRMITRAFSGIFCAPGEHLLPPMDPLDKDKYTLVLDMDGTLLTELIEDWFSGKNDARYCEKDFVVVPKSAGRFTFISMRPYLEEFLEKMARIFEIVIFTESPQKRADAILDKLPNNSLIRYRLYRDSCTEIEGKLVKDLSLLGRDLSRVIILDDCPFSYSLQPSNSFPIKRFLGLASDSELKGELPYTLSNLALENANVQRALKSKSVHDNREYFILPRKPLRGPLLPPMVGHKKKHTLVLDMDGTLLDYNLNVPICDDDFYSDSYGDSFKRPGVEKFLEEMEKIFELVLFTASTARRANMIMEGLFDPYHLFLFSHRLSREACLFCCKSFFIKDLSLLGRDLSKVILIDDNPLSYDLQPFNAIPIKTFRAGDTSDDELTKLIPFLRQLAQEENDVRPIIGAKYHDLGCVVCAPPKAQITA